MNKIIMVALLLVFLSGCATQSATVNSYVAPVLKEGQIKSVAILPIRNARFVPSEARQINRRVSEAFSALNPGVAIVSPSEAQRRINEAGLGSMFAHFLEDYGTSGLVDSNRLDKIAGALDVDAIMQGEVLRVNQEDGRYGGNKGTTRVTVTYSMLSAVHGKSVWEASSDGIAKTATTVEEAPPIIEAIDVAVDRVIENFPALSKDSNRKAVTRYLKKHQRQKEKNREGMQGAG